MEILVQRYLHGVVRWLPVTARFGGLPSEGQDIVDPGHGADEPTIAARNFHYPTRQRAVPWRGDTAGQRAVSREGARAGVDLHRGRAARARTYWETSHAERLQRRRFVGSLLTGQQIEGSEIDLIKC